MGTKKADKYRIDRDNITTQIREILQLDKDNAFYLYELENDEEKQRQIMALTPQIKIYFPAANWNRVNVNNNVRPYLAIIRNVFKKQGYLFVNNRANYTKETGEKVLTSRYFIIKKEE